MRRSFKTSTAIVASLALVVPHNLVAQDLGASMSAEDCGSSMSEAECQLYLDEGTLPEGMTEADLKAEVEAEAEADVESAPEAPADEAAPEAAEEAAPEAAEEAAPEATEEAAPEAAQDLPPEAAPEVTTQEATEPVEAEVEAETEALGEAVEETTGDVAQEVDETVDEVQEETTEKTVDEPAPGVEIDTQADVSVETDTAAETDSQTETTTEADAETETLGEALSDTAQDAVDKVEETVEGTADAVSDEAQADAEMEPEIDAQAQADAQAEALQQQAPVAALAADGEQDGAESDETVEVTTETVTEETARSSDEDFEATTTTEPAAEATVTASDDDDGGLSNLERALLIGAGAIGVGALLSGNREVVSQSDDRIVVQRADGSYEILKDDNALLRQPGNEVETQTFSDGSSRTVVTRPNGTQIITIRDPELRVVRRVSVAPDGMRTVLIDDTTQVQPVNVSTLPQPRVVRESDTLSDADLRAALRMQDGIDRTFSLSQVRSIDAVRNLAPAINLENITFETGSAAITPSQAEELADIGRLLADIIDENPGEIFLIEGHTDAVGGAAMNLTLSDRRAESVALALTEYFDVPPENLVVQGYGESDLRVRTGGAERANRRAVVRRITPLLQQQASLR